MEEMIIRIIRLPWSISHHSFGEAGIGVGEVNQRTLQVTPPWLVIQLIFQPLGNTSSWLFRIIFGCGRLSVINVISFISQILHSCHVRDYVRDRRQIVRQQDPCLRELELSWRCRHIKQYGPWSTVREAKNIQPSPNWSGQISPKAFELLLGNCVLLPFLVVSLSFEGNLQLLNFHG